MISIIERSITYKVIINDDIYIATITERDKEESIHIVAANGKEVPNRIWDEVENYIDKTLEE